MAKLKFIVIGLILVLIAAFIFVYTHGSNRSLSLTNFFHPSRQNTSSFNKHAYSLTDPASIWVIVNKKHPLNPINYTPSDLTVPAVALRVPGNDSMQMRSQAAKALEQMFSDAKAQGIQLMLASGYRSYDYQLNLYNGYVASMGQAKADETSARPGHSEHQTGLAVDIEPVSKNCELDPCFANTPEGQWLAANAYKYGFLLRYTPDKVQVTGYASEPWHYRYIGTQLAAELHKTNIKTLEEFFNVTGGTSY